MTRSLLFRAAALSMLLAAACSDTNKTPIDRSTADRLTGDRSTGERTDRMGRDYRTTDIPPGTCPQPVPAPGTACSGISHTCWYGSDPRWFCRPSALCVNGTWQVTPQAVDCLAPQPASCPATSSTPYAGCAVDAGTRPVCLYPDRYCACGFTGGPQDGWRCTVVPPNCPTVPPDEGDPCTAGAPSCLFYPCSRSALCVNGKWHWEEIDC